MVCGDGDDGELRAEVKRLRGSDTEFRPPRPNPCGVCGSPRDARGRCTFDECTAWASWKPPADREVEYQRENAVWREEVKRLRGLLKDARDEAQSLNDLLCPNIDAPYFDLELLARIEKEIT